MIFRSFSMYRDFQPLGWLFSCAQISFRSNYGCPKFDGHVVRPTPPSGDKKLLLVLLSTR